ncbi:IPT/TIG domain-containing protein [Stenotrophomonas sp. NPDC087984]
MRRSVPRHRHRPRLDQQLLTVLRHPHPGLPRPEQQCRTGRAHRRHAPRHGLPDRHRRHLRYDAPSAVSVTPAAQLSGQNVTIGGTCLLDATAVVLGSGPTHAPATFVNLSSTQILAVVPAVLPGTYSVLVTTPGGTDTAGPPSLLVL